MIGDSASYLGSAWIVPPPPIARDAMREPGEILHARLAVPLIATSRIHEPVEAEALLAAGAADAVGMTRALIADPDLPRRISEGREDERILCTGCNQGCIGHYHLGVPISCLQNPRTGREARMPAAAAQTGTRVARDRRRPGGHGGRRGRGRAGAEVTLLEATGRAGRPVRAGRPRAAHRETAAALHAPTGLARLAAADVDVRLDTRYTGSSELASGADRVIVATVRERTIRPCSRPRVSR